MDIDNKLIVAKGKGIERWEFLKNVSEEEIQASYSWGHLPRP